MMRRTISIMVSLAVCAGSASAQVSQLIDSGTLATSFGGTEEFTIVRNADRGYTLMITAVGGGRTMRSTLTTDSLGVATAYHHNGQGGDAVAKTRTLRKDDSGALLLTEQSTRQPPLSPFQMPQSALLFDEGGLAQHWFLGHGTIPRDVGFVLTRGGRPVAFTSPLVDAGRDSVNIEGVTIPASRLVLGTGNTRREIWLDSQKRLLKVVAPPNATAVRTKRPS